MPSAFQRLIIRIKTFCREHPRRAVMLAFAVAAFFWLSSFYLYPSLALTRVREGQTLDYFLHKTFNGSHDFAYAALDHIRQNAPSSLNPDYLQATRGLISKNGYLIGVSKGKLTIIAPNERFVVRDMPILSERLMRLFWLQNVLFHFIMAGCLSVLMIVIVRCSRAQAVRMVRNIAIAIIASPFLLPFFLAVLFLVFFVLFSFLTPFFS